MFNFGRRIAAFACTILMSSACVLGAVGPAQADAGSAPAPTHMVA